MAILKGSEAVRQVLQENHTIAVLGAHASEHKAAHYVPQYLREAGYTIYPINPGYQGRSLFGETVVASLQDLPKPVDIVQFFRRSDRLVKHVDDLLGMQTRPKVVWFQLGIRNDEVADTFSEEGIDVIQDRCMMVDHRNLL